MVFLNPNIQHNAGIPAIRRNIFIFHANIFMFIVYIDFQDKIWEELVRC